MRIASFDIFDTTLVRKCGTPENIFYLLSQRLYPKDSARANEFLVSRKKVAFLLSQKEPNYSLEDVYSDSEWNVFPEYSQIDFVQKEKQVESEQLISNPPVIDIISSYRNKGYNIVFISDMYLDSTFLASVLQREGAFSPGDIIYVSNEKKARKDDGALYDIVRFDLKPASWHHYGDNRYSDYQIAKRKKIEATLVDTSFSEIEKDLLKLGCLTAYPEQLSILVGISRAARLQQYNKTPALMAADYVCAIYIPYVIHILRDAKERGIKKLYFLSRDSYILKEIADGMNHEGIELYYLYVSRRSLLLPYLYNANKEDLLKIYPHSSLYGETVEELLSKLQITSEELSECNISISYNNIVNQQQEKDLLTILFDTALYDRWQARAKEQMSLVSDYFRQEGLFDEEPSALVDVGWIGSTRIMINKILDVSDIHVFSYYWAVLWKKMLPSIDCHYDTFIKNISMTSHSTSLVENYLSLCPYSTTYSYKKEDTGRVVPVLKDCSQHNVGVISLNREVSSFVTDYIKEIRFSSSTLYLWSRFSFEALSTHQYTYDYAFLVNIEMTDKPFVKRLTWKDVTRICAGRSVSEMDDYSLDYTFGPRVRKAVMKINRTSGEMIEKLRRLKGKLVCKQ